MSKVKTDAIETRAGGTSVLTIGTATQTIKLPGGTPGAGKYLQSDADGDASWATVSTTSDIELLNTYEPSGVADVEITTAAYFSSTYKSLIFKFMSMHPVTDNVHLRMQIGTGVGPTYAALFYTNFGIMQSNGGTNWWQYEGSYGGSGNWASLFATLFKEVGNQDFQSCAGELEIANPSSAAFYSQYQSKFNGDLYHDYQLTSFGGGSYRSIAPITAVRFYFNSGNIDSGIIKVYGLR